MLDELPRELLPQLAEQTPMGRLGTPEDIAAAVAFLPIRRQISSPARCSPATEGSSSNYWRKICGFSGKRLAVWCVRNFAAQRQNSTPVAGVVFSLTHMAR